MKTKLIPFIPSLVVLTLASLTAAASAQVVMMDKPFRKPGATAPGAAAAAPAGLALPIQPYAPATTTARPMSPREMRHAAPQAAAPVDVAPAMPSQATVASVAVPSMSASRWEITTADEKLSRTLGRWAQQSGTRLIWEAPKDLPTQAASYQGDFIVALEQVMRDSQTSQYPLHACVYDNVTRILHISQSCYR